MKLASHRGLQATAQRPERDETSRALVVDVRDSAGELGNVLLAPRPPRVQSLTLDVILTTQPEPAAGELVISQPGTVGD